MAYEKFFISYGHPAYAISSMINNGDVVFYRFQGSITVPSSTSGTIDTISFDKPLFAAAVMLSGDSDIHYDRLYILGKYTMGYTTTGVYLYLSFSNGSLVVTYQNSSGGSRSFTVNQSVIGFTVPDNMTIT